MGLRHRPDAYIIHTFAGTQLKNQPSVRVTAAEKDSLSNALPKDSVHLSRTANRCLSSTQNSSIHAAENSKLPAVTGTKENTNTVPASCCNGVERAQQTSHRPPLEYVHMGMCDQVCQYCVGLSFGFRNHANKRGDWASSPKCKRWAVDLNQYACTSLRLNHPETEVRNESVEDFLRLLREWAVLCQTFNVAGGIDLRRSL
ncbi:Bromo adjacent homology (BAH) domain-containing protein [Artemisia annua]|uniref:Bromo adjacent homology (BAH) domain-containing protein n=1 Tax=Artemisia annua TaxID=35608 RepID=A0A2U1KAG3_ARTAN|nr:Bromo adjacent homology (BAH) domain-containing protein [Artemisia annua]